MPAKPGNEPDRNNPLAEPTPGRRLWASYLARGFNRATFARALGVRYATVYDWDRGASLPQLDQLIRAADLVGMTLDEIAYGAAGRPVVGTEPDFDTDDAVRLALRRVGATDAQRAAFAEHRAGPGRFERCTRTYLLTYITSWSASIEAGMAPAAAAKKAHAAAVNARANIEAVAQGAKPIAPETLRGLASPKTGTLKRPRRVTPSHKRTR